jgi:septal ring factor EnvC (AmiA/AmiB activator)
MPEKTVTVSRGDLTSLKSEVIAKIEELKDQIAFITDPKSGLYLSVHDNKTKVASIEKEIEDLKTENKELKDQNAKFDRFRVQIVTAVGLIQTAFGVWIALT